MHFYQEEIDNVYRYTGKPQINHKLTKMWPEVQLKKHFYRYY